MIDRMTARSASFVARTSAPGTTGAVIRADQLERMAAAAAKRVVVVHAPAGYGKTTLVAAASEQLGWDALWYHMDALDQRPSLLVSTVWEALSPDRLGKRLVADPGSEALTVDLVTQFVAALGRSGRTDLHIVIDDYERAAEFVETQAMLELLIGNLPTNVRVVLLTRREPALRLARLRLADEVTAIHEDVLRFDAAQTQELLHRRRRAELSMAELERLVALTEGWAAGIELATQALEWREFDSVAEVLARPGVRHEMFAFLAEEVFDRQSDDVRRFLEETCYLEYLTADLARQMTGSDDAQRDLDYLAANRTFTVADTDGLTYRYHHLFREFLRDRCRAQDGDDAVRALMIRTATVLEKADEVESAVNLLLEAGEPGHVIELFQRGGRPALGACGTDCLGAVVAAINPADDSARAWTILIGAYLDDRAGRSARAVERFQAAASLFVRLDDRRSGCVALHAMQLRFFYDGDYAAAVRLGQQALELASDPRQRFDALFTWAITHVYLGRWDEAEDALREGDRLASAAGPAGPAKQMGLRATIACEYGDVRSALIGMRRAAGPIREHEASSDAGFLGALADMELSAGNYVEARRLGEECQEIARKRGLDALGALHADVLGEVMAVTGHAEAGLAMLDAIAASPGLAEDAEALADIHLRAATVWRRAGRLDVARRHLRAADACLSEDQVLWLRLSLRASVSLVRGLSDTNALKTAIAELESLRDEALTARLGFVAAQCDFFAVSLARRWRGRHSPAGVQARLRACVARLLELGQRHFVSQELALDVSMLEELLRAAKGTDLAVGILDAVACHWEARRLLSTIMRMDEAIALAAVDAAAEHLDGAALRRVLQRARRHGSVAVRARAQALASDVGVGASGPEAVFPELTPREVVVVARLAAGLKDREIAAQLDLSPATVKTHVHRILKKLGVSSRVQAAIMYRQRTEGGRSPIV